MLSDKSIVSVETCYVADQNRLESGVSLIVDVNGQGTEIVITLSELEALVKRVEQECL